ncbi:MAG: SPOR domain-containing protein [Cryomorphaceae bacterium]|nr:SPOR domain-containing protein [Cryomorphaceae bacterium]
MIKNYFCSFVLIFLAGFTLLAQDRENGKPYWSLGIDGGGMYIVNSKFTETNFHGYRLPLAGQVYAHYHFNEAFGVKGNIFTGISTGSDGAGQYYEGYYGESDIRFTFNALALRGEGVSDRTRLELDLGVGGMMFNSTMLQRTNDNVRPRLLTRIPANRSSSSLATIIAGSVRFSTTIFNDLSVNFGGQIFMALGNQWLDAYAEENDHSDFVIMPFVGLSYAFKNVAASDQVIIDETKYQALNNNIAELKQKVEEEKLKRDVMTEDFDAMSKALQREMDALLNEVDSMQALVAGQRASERVVDAKTDFAIVKDDSDDAMWRVVVGSYPTKELANRFVARTQLSKKEMIILYSERTQTYRVIYKSFAALNEAIEAREAARKEVSDAWIIKL